MKLHELVTAMHRFRGLPKENPEITSIEVNSQEVEPGSLFICIEGHTVDGHDYVREAASNGAVAAVTQKEVDVNIPTIKVRNSVRALAILANAFYGAPTSKLKMIGVTGTNGKTSVAHLIEAILQKSGQKTGLIGTIGMKIGNKAFKSQNTTPDALILQKMFHQMVEAKVETAVMEVSSHALHMGRVHGCQYDITVFTNLTQDHLDYHKTMDAYQRSKSLLFSQLGNGFDYQNPKYAVLNVDDSATEEYIVATQAIVITYGIDKDADIQARDIQVTGHGTAFTLIIHGMERQVNMRLVGKFNVYNVLATIGVTLASGLDLDFIISAIGKLEGVPGRFELVDVDQDFTVIVDYAHTPDSLENVLRTVQEFAVGKVYCVVGCGGDRDRSKRPMMAKIASQLADVAILTSDNPRTEDPLMILQDMEAGIQGEGYKVIVDRKEAITYAVDQAHAQDVILIAGKGHETYQIIGQDVLNFDDRVVASSAIKKKLMLK